MFQKLNELQLEICKVNFIRQYNGESAFTLEVFGVGITSWRVSIVHGAYNDVLSRESGMDLDAVLTSITKSRSRWDDEMTKRLPEWIKKAKARAFKHNDTDFQKNFEELFCEASPIG